jgi:hypothetical protein
MTRMLAHRWHGGGVWLALASTSACGALLGVDGFGPQPGSGGADPGSNSSAQEATAENSSATSAIAVTTRAV